MKHKGGIGPANNATHPYDLGNNMNCFKADTKHAK